MNKLTSKKQYDAPTLTAIELSLDVIATSAGAKYMGDEWNVMDDLTNN